jgi:hypothetical protein
MRVRRKQVGAGPLSERRIWRFVLRKGRTFLGRTPSHVTYFIRSALASSASSRDLNPLLPSYSSPLLPPPSARPLEARNLVPNARCFVSGHPHGPIKLCTLPRLRRVILQYVHLPFRYISRLFVPGNAGQRCNYTSSVAYVRPAPEHSPHKRRTPQQT